MSSFFWFRQVSEPKKVSAEDVVNYMNERKPLVPFPERVLSFWDVPALLVILLFVVALLLVAHWGWRRFLVAGVPLLQGDSPGEPAHTVVQAAATQTVPEEAPAVSTWENDWPVSADLSSSDVWVSPAAPVHVSFSPVMGPNLPYFVGLPWGTIFLGGAVFTGLLLAGWVFLPRRRLGWRRRAGSTFLFFPFVVVAGGASFCLYFYLGGVFAGRIAPPLVLFREGVVYFYDLFVPGSRNGRVSGSALVDDLLELVDSSFSSWNNASLTESAWPVVLVLTPRRVVAAVVSVGVTFVLGEHVVTVLSAGTDLDELARLARVERDLAEQISRFSYERVVRFESEVLPDETNKEVRLFNRKVAYGTRYLYTGATSFEQMVLVSEPRVSPWGLPWRRDTLLERAVAQVLRLWGWFWG